MAPFCKDEEKYKLVDEMSKKIKEYKKTNFKIDNSIITDILTINGIRFTLKMELGD